MSDSVSDNLPRRIKPLDPQLVNRIAAGEIIQRPFNALKELIENCLDAGSTSINIQIKDGGLSKIQIQDNGCGIDKDDLKIVCERFTTSKLKEFDDLKTINTFGFRGEALASISHVSRLTIVSRTKNSPCAYKASYTDGKLTTDGIKPCASATIGTLISVEDLFYNSSIRRSSLKTGNEEFTKIVEVVSRYAIHNYHVSFFLKRSNESSIDLKTVGCLSQTKKHRCEENETFLLDNIGMVYGNELKKELQRISINYDETFKFEMNGFISNSKFVQLKQMVFILFINERLVDCQPIKKAINGVFTLYLPKNTNYFVYLNLVMNPKNLDVNIHPTKHEVRFLYQDEIISKIQTCFEQTMLNSSVSRTHCAKNLTLDPFVNITSTKLNTSETNLDDSKLNNKIIYPYQMTRVDSRERKIDSFLHQNTSINESFRNAKESSQKSKLSNDKKLPSIKENTFESPLRHQKLERKFNLKSLFDLREAIEKSGSKRIFQMFQDMNFVGVVNRELGLIQHQTALYLLNTRKLSEELFYQIQIFNFGNFGYYRLKEPMPIADLAYMALENPIAEWTPEDGPKEKLSKRVAKFLYSKSKMLDDYFSIKINRSKCIDTEEYIFTLETLPILIENYEPDLNELPIFIIRLASEVEWKQEKECLDTISREIASFYSIKNPIDQSNVDPSINSSQEITSDAKPTECWIIEHVLFSAFRNMLLISSDFEKEILFKLVDLSKLYKVFERC